MAVTFSFFSGVVAIDKRVHGYLARTFQKIVQTSNEKVVKINRVLELPRNGLKQAYDLQHSSLTSLIHFVQLYTKVD